MALDVTITPDAGHAVLLTQGGDGASPEGYDAIDWRRIMTCSGMFQPGAFDATAWKVSERGAGTNMSVDVAASVGMLAVRNQALLVPQDMYLVAPHSALVNLATVPANNSADPRKDLIVVQVRDQDHDGSDQYDARVRWLTGTATSGATQDNTLGQPSVPDSCVVLAQALLPPSTTTAITNAMIRDRRPWARGAAVLTEMGAGAAYQITSASMVEVDATNLKWRIELSGLPVRMTFEGSVLAVSADKRASLSFWLDGAQVSSVHSVVSSPAGASMGASLSRTTTPSAAGSHVIALRAANTDSDTRIDVGRPLSVLIEELSRASSSNGAA